MQDGPTWGPSMLVPKSPHEEARLYEGLTLCSGEQAAHLLHRVRLDLANAFGGNAVLVRQILQRGLVVVIKPAALDDVAGALVEVAQRIGQRLHLIVRVVLVGYVLVRIGAIVDQERRRCRLGI